MRASLSHRLRHRLPLLALLALLLGACGPRPAATPGPATSPPASPPPGPTASPPPGPTASPPPAGRVVTLADDGQTLTLQPGERLSLRLDLEYDWTVAVDDPAVLAQVEPAGPDGQGVFEAGLPGPATLTAVGDPPCRKLEPPCGRPSRLFTLSISVRRPE